MTAPPLAATIARAATDVDEIPADVLDAARLHFLDALGVGTAAARVGPVRNIVAHAGELAGSGGATVIGRREPVGAGAAALVNGTLIHSLEYDDTHVASVMHGSSVMAAASLASAEQHGADGAAMLRAFTVGWELLIRFGMATNGSLQAAGFQPTSAAGPFAAALADGLVHRDSWQTVTSALGIAGIQPGGNFAFLATAATVKAAQPGWAAHAGLIAAGLARAGITGPSSVLEGPSGFFALYGHDDAAASLLRETLDTFGAKWQLPDAAFKAYPCCHFIHPFLECLDRLPRRVTAEEVQELRCVVPVEQMPVIGDPWEGKQHPRNGHDARWSLPYVLAARLHDGSVDLGLFDGPARPELSALAERITVEPWHGSGHPSRFPARLSVVLDTGDTMSADVVDVRGGPARPFDTEMVVAKFRANARSGNLPDDAAEELVEQLLSTASPDVPTIGRILRAAGT